MVTLKEITMKMNKKALAILSAGHLVTDINQGALPALLPFFKEALNLSYTTSGVILLSSNLTSSIIQPAFGHLSDRRPIGWFLPFSPLIACLGLSITGFLSSYSLLLLCVMLTGFGVASFHPEGFKTAYFFTGDKKATGMSIFAVGGSFGIAVGPILALTLVTSFGLKGILGLIIPGILIAIVLLFNLSMLFTPVKFAHKEAKKEVKTTSFQKPKEVVFSSHQHRHRESMGPTRTGSLHSFLLHQLSKRKSPLCGETRFNFSYGRCFRNTYRCPISRSVGSQKIPADHLDIVVPSSSPFL